MRGRVKLKKIMALAMSIMLGISAIGCSSDKIDDSEIVMSVDGIEINAGTYKKTLELFKQSIEAMYGPEVWDQEVEKGVKYRNKFKDLILTQTIETEAVYATVKANNMLPSKEEIDNAFKDLKASIEKDEEYKKNLESIGVDDAFLREQQEKELAWQKYKENFDKTTVISEQEVQKYYDENKETFYRDEVKASHILISTLDDKEKELPKDKKEEAKKKAEDILKRARAGEEFSVLAKEYSQDPASVTNGGDLGYFKKGQMVKEFEDAAFSTKVGEISDIVESKFGYHIIKVTDRVDEQTTVEDNKDYIKETLLESKYVEQIKKLGENAKVEKNQELLDKIKL
ncbi:MAG: peptidylprolyl isomerase [Romboutsia sp.]